MKQIIVIIDRDEKFYHWIDNNNGICILKNIISHEEIEMSFKELKEKQLKQELIIMDYPKIIRTYEDFMSLANENMDKFIFPVTDYPLDTLGILDGNRFCPITFHHENSSLDKTTKVKCTNCKFNFEIISKEVGFTPNFCPKCGVSLVKG